MRKSGRPAAEAPWDSMTGCSPRTPPGEGACCGEMGQVGGGGGWGLFEKGGATGAEGTWTWTWTWTTSLARGRGLGAPSESPRQVTERTSMRHALLLPRPFRFEEERGRR